MDSASGVRPVTILVTGFGVSVILISSFLSSPSNSLWSKSGGPSLEHFAKPKRTQETQEDTCLPTKASLDGIKNKRKRNQRTHFHSTY